MSAFLMTSLTLLLLLLMSSLLAEDSRVEARTIEVKCPEFCECDVFETLKRAVCRDRSLVSMELNVPAQAQILDMSYNQISELGDKIFVEIGLTHLKLLNLSHNKVNQIHFNGFIGLERLKTLDLSFNAIEYFTKSWFESLQSLEELYLRGNKLRTINRQPPIDIASLRVLDISKCGLTSLKAKSFEHVQSLQILDISDNFLQTLQVEVAKTLPNLTHLNLHNNNFDCKNKNVNELKKYAKSHRIVFSDSCVLTFEPSFTVNEGVHQFEKIQMEEDTDNEGPPPKEVISNKNAWIFDVDDFNDTKIIEVCSNATFNDENLLMEIIRLSPWLVLSITFVYGVLCGMVILCAINLCTKRRDDAIALGSSSDMPDGIVNCNVRSTPSIRRGERRNLQRTGSVLYGTIRKARRNLSREQLEEDNYDETLMLHEFDVANSTPVVGRRQIT